MNKKLFLIPFQKKCFFFSSERKRRAEL